MKLGDAFTMPVPPQYDRPHLFFVITDPDQNGGVFVVVNITTNDIRAGRECVFNVGDHPWITKESYVSFGDALETTVGKITPLIGTKIVLEAPLSQPALAKIVEAARTSKALPSKLKRYFSENPLDWNRSRNVPGA